MHKDLPYNFKVNNVATDINCITPGMIYVDIGHKNRDDFYIAFQKGASLIITDGSISDSSLPIVKVEDVEWAYLRLLNILYENLLDKVSFISIYGGSQGNIVANILGTIFKKYRFNGNLAGSYTLSFGEGAIFNWDIEGFFNYTMDCFINGINIIPISMEFVSKSSSLQEFISRNTDCLIIENCPSLDFKGNVKTEKPLIINIDKPLNLEMIKDETSDFIITYGLSKKASVTATSIDYGEYTNFNYCLQRNFFSKTQKMIEPFETPLSIRGLGINRIYSALAAVSCALYYDMDMKLIKKSLMEYSEKGRNLLIKGYDKFTLIDNFCTDYSGVKETFEMIQLLDYQSLHLLVSQNLINKIQSEPKMADNLLELIMNSNVKEVIISDYIESFNNESICQATIKTAKQNNINIKTVSGLANAITYILSIINKNDALLILGGKEFNTSKTIVELLITEEIS